jgi:hypothetical protein
MGRDGCHPRWRRSDGRRFGRGGGAGESERGEEGENEDDLRAIAPVTKRVRATVNYVLNRFPDGSAGSPIIGNLMREVAARVGVQF